jgi:predicted O-methyltransferase YrrM
LRPLNTTAKIKAVVTTNPVLFRLVRRIVGLGRFLYLIYAVAASRTLRFLLFAPPGYFYSSVPALSDALSATEVAKDIKECPGVALNESAQLELVENFSRYHGQLPFSARPDSKLRYYYDNRFYSYGDGIILYSFLRHYKPRHIIEVGSGFSSALMLDVNDLFLGNSINITLVEPNPGRLFSILKAEDSTKCTIFAQPLQQTDLALFETLAEHDILFIDSSHIVKAGSDLAHILSNVLPSLKPGVIIHFHDIMWPFEYPRLWFEYGRAFNEAYMLKSFLQYNSNFEIIYFNSYLACYHIETLRQKLPLCLEKPSAILTEGNCSIWLQRVK